MLYEVITGTSNYGELAERLTPLLLYLLSLLLTAMKNFGNCFFCDFVYKCNPMSRKLLRLVVSKKYTNKGIDNEVA